MFGKQWQLINTFGRTEVSTVELPNIPGFDLGYRFETCVFFRDGSSEVVARYQSRAEATLGHRTACARYGT